LQQYKQFILRRPYLSLLLNVTRSSADADKLVRRV